MSDPLQWLHFEPSTLARAEQEDKLLLMVITAPWCQHSRELLSTSFADPEVTAAVRDAFVPVHIDSERRPDVNQRYGTGAWPTIAWLTPQGELIAQDNFLDAAELHVRIGRIRDAWRSDKDNIQRRIGELWSQLDERNTKSGGQLRREMVDDITDASLEDVYHALLFENWGGARRILKDAKAATETDRFLRRWFTAAIAVEADWHLECAARFVAVGDLDAVARMIERTRSSFGDTLDKRLRALERRLRTNAGVATLAAARAYATACEGGDDAKIRAFAAAHDGTVYATAARHHLANGGGSKGHRLDWFLEQDRYLARFGYLTLE